MFAVRHWGVEPDILVMAKGIASGLPLSGILARRELMAHWTPGHARRHVRRQRRVAAPRPTRPSTSSRTRGSWPTPASAAPSSWPGCAPLASRYRAHRRRARPGPDGRASSSSSPTRATAGSRTRTSTKRIQAEALTRKLIVLTAGTYVNVIRIIPPLVTTAEEVDLALAILDESLAAAGA